MKKRFAFSLALTMGLSLCACGAPNSGETNSAASQTTEAAKELTPADQLLEDVRGTYDELFTVICDSQCDQIWLDKCEAIVGADMAENYADMLKSACTGTLYGEDAVSAYANAESAQFDCCFINGVHQFVFDGSHISGLDENGGKIIGAVTPGAVAGRAEKSVIESCNAVVTLDGKALTDEIGKTDNTMYESADQSSEESEEEAAEEKTAA